MEGAGSVTRLLVEVMKKRIGSLGFDLDSRLIEEAFRRVRTGYMSPEKMGPVVLSTETPGHRNLAATVGDLWKVSLRYQEDEDAGSVSVFAKLSHGAPAHGWRSQDMPDGSPAKTFVAASEKGSMQSGVLAYVCRETHMFEGMLWDRSTDTPAEIAYYPNGNVYWRQRYQNGTAKGRIGLPVFENYWDNGSVRILEFGNDLVGKTRPLSEGPAYSEYYPDGRLAAEIHAERRWDEVSGCSTLLPGWRARYFDTAGERTIRKVLLEIKKEGGWVNEEVVRDMVDRGENKMEEQLFVEKFTESIRLRDCTHPSPFFITSESIRPRPAAAAKVAKGLSKGSPKAPAPRLGNLGGLPASTSCKQPHS
jgi:hypothetical protein